MGKKKQRTLNGTHRVVSGTPRVLFYSHDGLGLGHFRITLSVMEALNLAAPKSCSLILTGLASAGLFTLTDRCDFVRMPGLDKRSLFLGNARKDRDAPTDIFDLRTAIVEATIERFAPHLIVVDHNPVGLAGELLPILKRMRDARRRPRFVLGMRDITYGPEQTRREWERTGALELMEQFYDAILVYGHPDVYDPVQEYGLSDAIARKITFTGFFRRSNEPPRAEKTRRALGAATMPLVVVSAGGGADGATLIGTFLQAVQAGMLGEFVASVVAGPQMPEPDFARLCQVAASLPATTFVRFRNDLEDHVAAAAVVVTMGGYNSVWEAVGAGKRPIIVPRQGGSDEQPLRAARLQALGLASLLSPDTLTPEILAAAIAAEFARPAPPPGALPFDGIDRAGEALARLLKRK